MNLVHHVLSFGLLLVAASASAAEFDGPYLSPDKQGAWIARWADLSEPGGTPVREQRLKVGQSFSIPAVGTCPAFKVRLRKSDPVAPDQVSFSSQAPLLIVADTHGEFEIFCELLRKQRVVDSKLRWSFGRGHLVVLGDMFDRGAHQTEILWLLYQLEAEARQAGGGLHVGLGNHEVMALRGDARYLNPKYGRAAGALGASAYAELFAADTLLGQWLRTKPAVFKANDVLCLHGGISKEIIDQGFSLAEMNAAVRASLDTNHTLTERERIAVGPLGPLWYRGYFPAEKDFPTATDADIDGILKTFGVATIAVGHTIVPTVTPLYNHRVLAVQVYPHHDEHSGASVLQGAILENGAWLRANIDGAREPLSGIGK
jgi:hypothetical protein